MENVSTGIIRAPFTDEQVKNLNDYQKNGDMHPFTGKGRMAKRIPRKLKKMMIKDMGVKDYHQAIKEGSRNNCPDKECLLIATKKGFVCPCGNYTQDWCHSFMADKV